MNIDFQTLDPWAFKKLLATGNVKRAFDVNDWKELPSDDELKVAYEQYLFRNEVYQDRKDTLSFTDYFVTVSKQWEVLMTVDSLTNIFSGGCVEFDDILPLLQERVKEYSERLAL